MMDITEIQHHIPHRYPFLLVDRILELEKGKRIVGIKNVTINEAFFTGHFPKNPIMPGVLIIEAMAQVGDVLWSASFGMKEGSVHYFVGIDKARFHRPVRPGDQIRFEIEMVHNRNRSCKMHGKAFVDGKMAVEAELLSILVEPEE